MSKYETDEPNLEPKGAFIHKEVNPEFSAYINHRGVIDFMGFVQGDVEHGRDVLFPNIITFDDFLYECAEIADPWAKNDPFANVNSGAYYLMDKSTLARLKVQINHRLGTVTRDTKEKVENDRRIFPAMRVLLLVTTIQDFKRNKETRAYNKHLVKMLTTHNQFKTLDEIDNIPPNVRGYLRELIKSKKLSKKEMN
jgi:hypothetical protein